MVEIGEEVSEQLDIVRMQIRVLRHICKRYACPGGDTAPVIAALPARVLPKSNASNDFLAMLLTLKYVDGLPTARIEHVLARSHATVPRQTQARWIIGAARALQPLHNLMRDVLLDASVLHMDETTIQVLKEPGRRRNPPATCGCKRVARRASRWCCTTTMPADRGRYRCACSKAGVGT